MGLEKGPKRYDSHWFIIFVDSASKDKASTGRQS